MTLHLTGGLLALVVLINLASAAKPLPDSGHFCNNEKPTKTTKKASCTEFKKLVLDGYNVNKKASGLDKMPYQDAQQILNGNNPSTKEKQCTFTKRTTKKVRECCAGWSGKACDKAICDPDCANGGRCVSAGKCDCPDGFKGYRCEDKEDAVTKKAKYCYEGRRCFGKHPDGVDDVVAQDECCAAGGSWGLSGSPDCTPCAKAGHGSSGVVRKHSNSPFATCLNFGPSYYRTFDGVEYQYGGQCEYVLAQLDGAWTVRLKTHNCHSSAKCRKIITVKVGDELTIRLKGRDIAVNDEAVNITAFGGTHVKGVSFEDRGDFTYLHTHRLSLKWDDESTVYVTIPKEFKKHKIRGLCGNYNGDTGDDFTNRLGKQETSAVAFANSWAVINKKDPCNAAGESTFSCGSESDLMKGRKACYSLKRSMFKKCHQIINVETWFDRCVNDYCGAKSKADRTSVLCTTLAAFAHECADNKVVVEWRSAKLCPKQCPRGMQYSECASSCPRTCQTLNAMLSDECKRDCVHGCHCSPGTFLTHGGSCVLPKDCKCERFGKFYNPGEHVKMDCNKCTCKFGQWECEKNECDATCRVVGNLHFHTFDGSDFTFQGKPCKYTLIEPLPEMKKNKRARLEVSVVNGKCSERAEGYCVKEVHVTVPGAHIQLRGKSVYINGEQKDTGLPYKSRHVLVKRASSLFTLVQSFGFKLLWDGSGNLYATVEPFFMRKVRGLCGSYDRNSENDYLVPTGAEETDSERFADSYVDRLLCCVPYNPALKFSDPCKSQPDLASLAEKTCSPLREREVFGSCLDRIDSDNFVEQCKFDVCAAGFGHHSRPFCNVLGALARECAQVGVHVNWDENANISRHCDARCPTGQEFKQCSSPCGNTCRDLQLQETSCDTTECVAGCRCKEGTYLNDGGECVKRKQCNCWDRFDPENKHGPGDVIYRGCTNCTCESGLWKCGEEKCDKKHKCPHNQIYRSDLTNCEKTCAQADAKCVENPDLAHEGCGCPVNHFMTHEGHCVKADECPCQHANDWYDAKKLIVFGCKEYVCRERKWQFRRDLDCPAVCWASGDPHYMSFDGKMFSFMGKCTYTLTEAVDGSFSITSESVPCGASEVTCTKNIFIHIDDTKIQLLRGKPIEINGIALDDTEYDGAGLKVLRAGLFVHVVTSRGIELMWDGGTRVYVYLRSRWANKVRGLCGNFNGDATDDFTRRDNALAARASEFGNSWKHRETCADVAQDDPVQTMSGCGTPELVYREKWASAKCRLISEGELFETCRNKMTPEVVNFYHKSCVYDACRCDRGADCECMCTAIANFAEACNQRGVPVRWRSQHMCPMMCEGEARVALRLGLADDDLVDEAQCTRYEPCGPPCAQTCRNIGDEPEPHCKSAHCVEGCFCGEGKVLERGRCIDARDCPCRHDGKEFNPKRLELTCID